MTAGRVAPVLVAFGTDSTLATRAPGIRGVVEDTLTTGEGRPPRSGRYYWFRFLVSVDVGGEEVTEEDEEGDEPGRVRWHRGEVSIPVVE